MSQPVSIRGAQLRRDGEDLEIPPLFSTEAQFTNAVVNLARSCGWLVYHARPAVVRSGKWATHMQGDTGFPDIVAVHPSGRLVFAELKMLPETRITGRPREDQQRWLDALQEVAYVAWHGLDGLPEVAEAALDVVTVRVWRPADYDREIVPTFTGVWEVSNAKSAPDAPGSNLSSAIVEKARGYGRGEYGLTEPLSRYVVDFTLALASVLKERIGKDPSIAAADGEMSLKATFPSGDELYVEITDDGIDAVVYSQDSGLRQLSPSELWLWASGAESAAEVRG